MPDIPSTHDVIELLEARRKALEPLQASQPTGTTHLIELLNLQPRSVIHPSVKWQHNPSVPHARERIDCLHATNSFK
jgi:hypothetical protein